MKSFINFSVMICLLTCFQTTADGKIYSWTDENGIRQYSNIEPNLPAEEITVLQEDQPGASEGPPRSGTQELKKVVRELEAENLAAQKEREAKRQQREKQEQQATQEAMDNKIQAEKARLKTEISRIEKLAVGPNLSIALKNARIKQFQDQLDLLERSPETYFKTADR